MQIYELVHIYVLLLTYILLVKFLVKPHFQCGNRTNQAPISSHLVLRIGGSGYSEN